MNTSATFSLAIMLSAINRTGGAFGAVEQQAAGLQRSFSKTKDAANKLFNIGSAVSVGLGGWFIKQGMDFERTGVRMQVLIGDAEKAQKVIKTLNDFAKETLYSSSETYTAATPLLNYYKDADVVREKLMMLSDVSQGLGTITLQELSQKFAIFRAQQTLFTQDIKEMTNRGFDLKYFADALGISQEKVMDFASEGKIKFKDYEKALQLATEEGGAFYKMTDRISETAGGRFDAAMGELQQHLTTMSVQVLPLLNSGIKELLVPFAQLTGEFINANPAISGFIAKAALFATAAYPIYQVARLIRYTFTGVAQLGGVAISSIVNFTRALKALRAAEAAGNMAQWYGALARYGGAGNLAAKALRYAKIEQIGFNRATLLNPYIMAASALAALVVGVGVYLAKKKELSAAEQMEVDANKAAIEQSAQKKASLREEIDHIATLKEGTAEYSAAMNRLQANYGAYVRDLDLSKATKRELPELSKKIAEGIDLEAKALALARLKSEQYYEAEKARMEASTLLTANGDKANWADKLGDVGFKATARYFGNVSKANELNASAEDIEANIIALNEMQQRNNAEIRLTTNVVLDGKTVGSAVNNINRIDNRGSYE